jgi:threonylcarbamoyladenosine tRNA methylthiotransferase MtaB
MKKVAFYTLGCKLNYSETSTIARLFEKAGYEKVDFTEKPDIFIINTCSVTENADKKCKKIVKEALKISPDAFVAIMGCYAQLKPAEIAHIEGVDAVLGAAEKFRLLELIPTFEKKSKPEKVQIFHSDISQANQFYCSYSINDRTRTFLKVQDGCNYSCSFCTIPMARGESRSDSIKNIIQIAQEIAATDVKEVVLTGVNIGDFGLQENVRKEKFLDLIKQLDQVQGIERFRISSIEPNLLKDEIIKFIADAQRFVPHFHIPLQSGCNKILRLMRRRYVRELYAEKVELIKKLMPDCCIGVDVIVGFPGESHEDFLETYHFLNNLDISYLHVFTYSERDNTAAATLPDAVPMKDRNERSKILHILSNKKRRHFYESQLGKEKTVLFEADIENGKMHGFTENYVRVSAKYDPMLINEIRKVRLTALNEHGLVEIEEAGETLMHA